MKEHVTKQGGMPQRKPNKVMSIEELKEKAENLAGVKPKSFVDQLKELL